MKYDLEFIKRIMKRLPVNVFFKDAECRYVFATQYWRHIKKSSEKDWSIEGKTDLEIRVNASNAMLAYNQDRKIIETGEGCKYVIEEVIDGKTEYLEITKSPVFDDEGNVIGIVGFVNDITTQIYDRKHIDEYTSYDIMSGLYNHKGFIENFYRIFKNNKDRPAVIIFLSCELGEDAVLSYNNILYLANAMRIPLTPDKICARINKDVFAAAIALGTDELPEQRVERFIRDVVSSRAAYTLSIPDYVHPEIKYVWEVTEDNSLDKLDDMISILSYKIDKAVTSENKAFLSDKKKYTNLREMIYKYPEREWNIDGIVKGLAVSKSDFFRKYKKYFMTSCAADIINSRINKASELLAFTDLTISQISARCGYKSENYFTHQFRNVTGITASQYRQKHKISRKEDTV